MKVLKFQVPINDQGIIIRKVNKIVHVDMAIGDPLNVLVWAAVESQHYDAHIMKWVYDQAFDLRAQVFGTGHLIPQVMRHVGTAVDRENGQWRVWHVFVQPF